MYDDDRRMGRASKVNNVPTPHASFSVGRRADRAAFPDVEGGAGDDITSVLIHYLPGVYRGDPIVNQLLLIFESVLLPLERVVDTLPFYTEPEMAPEEFLPWLAQWVGAALDGAWPVPRQRALISHAAEIYRWRGTRRGLAMHIAAYTGIEPLIQEYRDGFVLGPACILGLTTRLLSTESNPVLFVVTVIVDDPRPIDPQVLRAIIEEDKPAHTTYRLRMVRRVMTPEPE